MAAPRIFIVTDLEGATLVTRWKQTTPDGDPDLYRQACSLLTGDVNAVVDGILDHDADSLVVVWDAHGCGAIDISAFHSRAWLVPPGTAHFASMMQTPYDALFFVGQHAMAGVPQALLCHTYSNDVEYHTLNGEPTGEFSERAYLAAAEGIPTVFVSGDDKAVAEAKAVVPGLVGAAVKIGLDVEAGMCMGPGLARGLLRERAREAAGRIGEFAPVAPTGPFRYEVRLNDRGTIKHYADAGYTILNAHTAVKEAATLQELGLI